MTALLRGIAVFLILASAIRAETPQVNLPQSIRQHNWIGNQGQGSCVHASMVMLLRWQRHYELADWWRRSYANGENWNGLTSKANQAGVRWAGTINQQNVAFLEWACKTRRGCMVTCQDAEHMVILVHLDDKWAGIIDNNAPERVIWKSRQDFLTEWNASYSWALTPVYTPPPPKLVRPK